VSHGNADPDVTILLQAGREPDSEPLGRRDLYAESLLGALFVVAAVLLGLSFDSDRVWPAEHALVLTILFALALRVRFEVGAGYTQPVQLAFVPMLLLLPTPWVPLLVLAAFLLERIPDLARSNLHPTRLLLLPNNAWFALAPALVLAVGDAQTPDWGAWPVYLAALASQFVVDLGITQLREWLAHGIAPRIQIRAITVVPLIDGLLSPLGLLAAFASETFEFAYLLLVPPAALLMVYAHERARRVRAATELVESEREAVRSREALVAGASHELLTPLAVINGLANRLTSGTELDRERRRQAEASLRREVAVLRHLTRQFVDYTRVKAGQPLAVRPRPTPIAEALEEVAAAYEARADVAIALNGARPTAQVDPDRLQQMLMVLVSNAVKHAPGAPVRLSARAMGERIEIAVSDEGPGIPEDLLTAVFDDLRQGEGSAEGAGIGLFLCRTLARAHGGEVRVERSGERGATFVLTLPAA
jgi:signal transduction histidine kinase